MSLNFAQLLEEAQAEGIGGALLPVGDYTLLAKVVKVQKSQGGKDQIGVMWQITEGPNAGLTAWENQTLSPENPKAMAAFFGWAKRFGMDSDFFRREPQPTLPEIASVIDGIVVTATVGLGKPWGKNNDKQDNTFKVNTVLGKQGGLPVASVPAAAPVVPAAAPVAPVAVPVAPVAPAAPEPVYVAPAPVAAVPVAPVAEAVPAAVPQPVGQVDPTTGLPVRSF